MSEAMQEQKNRKRKLAIALCTVGTIVLLVVIGLAGLALSEREANKVVVNPEAFIYEDGSSPFEILASDEESVTVSSLDALEDYSVLVAGVSKNAPSGLLRTLGQAEQVEGGYRLEALPAPLTAAIEKCDVQTEVTFYEDGTVEVDEGRPHGILSDLIPQAFAAEDFESNLVDKTLGPLYLKAGYQFTFDLCIDGGEVRATLLGHFVASTGLEFNEENEEGREEKESEGGSAKSKSQSHGESRDSEAEGSFNLEQTLFEYEEPVSFSIGPVPVVIDLDFSIGTEITARLEGMEFETSATIDRTWGVEYSTTDGVFVIDEDDSSCPGFSFGNPGPDIAASIQAGVNASLLGKLYGIGGPELSIGVQNDVTGALKETTSNEGLALPGTDARYEGRLGAHGYVPITGSLKVDIPDFNPFDWGGDGEELINIELFDTGDALTLYEWVEQYGVDMLTYRTSLGDYWDTPVLEFEYPSTWSLDVDRSRLIEGVHQEHIKLLSPDGCQVKLSHYMPTDALPNGVLDGYLTKVSSAAFEPGLAWGSDYSGLGSFMVAQLDGDFHGKMVGAAGESELTKAFDWSCALVPSSWSGKQTEMPAVVVVEEEPKLKKTYTICFPYGGCISMTASTEKGAGDPGPIDKMDAIAILASLHIVDWRAEAQSNG